MEDIKVAVCVSGICGDDTLRNMDMLQSQLPYDFFFGVWDGKENNVSRKLNAVSFDEPKSTYHHYCDITDNSYTTFMNVRNRIIQSGYHSKYDNRRYQANQIVAHAHMLDYIPNDYNMIIRTRYDIIISNKIDYDSYIKESYKNNCAMGFGTIYAVNPTIHSIVNAPVKRWEKYLIDNFIIHPRSLFDTKRVFKLINDQQLKPAEFGWYQILSEPHGSGDTHKCFCGASQVNRSIKQQDMQILLQNK